MLVKGLLTLLHYHPLRQAQYLLRRRANTQGEDDEREEGEEEARRARQYEMNQADQVAIGPPRDNRWKTRYEPGSFLVEAAERAAEAVGHSDLEEEEVQWENQAGNGAEDSIDSTTTTPFVQETSSNSLPLAGLGFAGGCGVASWLVRGSR